ncbi:MAG: hypothetical protein NVSMB32_01860 [Actinomycetota bacterium]
MRVWIAQRFAVYARLLLLAGLVLSPVLYRRDTVDVFNLVKLTILFVTAVMALALWVILSAHRGVWLPRLRIFWVAGAFLAAQALATATSQNVSMSILGVVHRYGGLIPFLLYATSAVVMVGLYWERPADLKEIPRGIAIASFVVTLDILMQKLGLDWIPWRSATYRPSFPVGTFGNSNFAGGFLAVAAPLFLYVVLSTRSRAWKWLLAGAFALDLLALWFTQTRGAFIGVGLAAAALALLAQDRLPRWLRRLAVVGFLAAGVVFILVVFHPGMRQAPSVFAAAGAFSPFRTGTFQDRSYYWIAALRIFRHHPLLGTGPDTYAANYTRFRLAQDGAKLGLILTDKPHNIFFEYAANSGVIGLGAYLSLLGSALVYGYRRVHQLEGNTRLLLMMFLASLVTYMGQGFFSIDLPTIAVMGWVALAGIAILADPGALAARSRLELSVEAGEAPPRKTHRLLGATVVVAALLAVVLGVRPFWADRLAHSAQLLQDIPAVRPDQASAAFQHAAAFLPIEPSYQSMAGNVYEAAGDKATDAGAKSNAYRLALERYRQAMLLQPHNIFYVMNLARVHTSWGASDASHYPIADELWHRALQEDPTDWQVHEFYALMLYSWADSDPANQTRRAASAQQFATVVTMRPSDLAAWVNLVRLYRALGEPAQAEHALAVARELGPTNSEVLALVPPGAASPPASASR